MRTAIVILAVAFLAVAPAAAKSAKSFAPGHHAGVTGACPDLSQYQRSLGALGALKIYKESACSKNAIE
jgi:hypothetical protein